MKNKLKNIFLMVLLYLAYGCAFISQQVSLHPQASVVESDIGRGQEVTVTVKDERPTGSLGHRGLTYGKGAEIATSQDVAQVFLDAILHGLRKKGFRQTSRSDDIGRLLKVEVRSLEYSTSTGFWTNGIHLQAAVKAIAVAGRTPYENFYRVDHNERVMHAPYASENEELLNRVISDVLTQLFQDQTLLAYLAS